MSVVLEKGTQAIEMLNQGFSRETVAMILGIGPRTLVTYITKARKPEKYATYGRDMMRKYRASDYPVGSDQWWKARGF